MRSFALAVHGDEGGHEAAEGVGRTFGMLLDTLLACCTVVCIAGGYVHGEVQDGQGVWREG